jgi:hypothetical protein
LKFTSDPQSGEREESRWFGEGVRGKKKKRKTKKKKKHRKSSIKSPKKTKRVTQGQRKGSHRKTHESAGMEAGGTDRPHTLTFGPRRCWGWRASWGQQGRSAQGLGHPTQDASTVLDLGSRRDIKTDKKNPTVARPCHSPPGKPQGLTSRSSPLRRRSYSRICPSCFSAVSTLPRQAFRRGHRPQPRPLQKPRPQPRLSAKPTLSPPTLPA